MKITKHLLIGLLIGVIIISSGDYVIYATAFPQNPITYNYFNKICDMPFVETQGLQTAQFWQTGGDCYDRAYIFAKYLKSKGEKNVQLSFAFKLNNKGMPLKLKDGQYCGHAFVIWNNKIYYPSHNKLDRIYDADMIYYQKFLKEKYGFNTIYVGNNPTPISF
jgi:hypothetical protein